MTDLPPGWEWVTLGGVGEWSGGGTPSKSNSAFWVNGTIPWISPKDISAPTIIKSTDHITKSALAGSSVRLIPPNSVVIVVRSGILERTVPTAIVPFATTLNQDLKALTPHPGISYKWIAYCLRALEGNILNTCRKSGTTVASVDVPRLMQLRIPLAPFAEQHRIVAALDDCISHLEDAEDTLHLVLHRVVNLSSSILNMAVDGDLGEGDSSDVSAAILLDQIAEKRRKGGNGDRRAMSARGPVRAVPERWVVASLDQLARRVQYGTSAKASVEDSPTSLPVIRMGNIQNGSLKIDHLKYLPADHHDLADRVLGHGDLLFNRTNSAELVGKSAVYQEESRQATFASYLIRCQFMSGVVPEWVNLVINSATGRRYVRSVASQQVGQANVSGTKLRQMPIPLPPTAEQQRIVQRIAEMSHFIERITTQVTAALRRSQALRGAILAHAFTGRLIPQDPNDESASALLEQIKAERLAQPKAKRARRNTNPDQERML